MGAQKTRTAEDFAIVEAISKLPDDALLTYREVALLENVSLTTINKRIRDGILPTVKPLHDKKGKNGVSRIRLGAIRDLYREGGR